MAHIRGKSIFHCFFSHRKVIKNPSDMQKNSPKKKSSHRYAKRPVLTLKGRPPSMIRANPCEDSPTCGYFILSRSPFDIGESGFSRFILASERSCTPYD